MNWLFRNFTATPKPSAFKTRPTVSSLGMEHPSLEGNYLGDGIRQDACIMIYMSATSLKDLPIGIQTFEKIVEGNYLYIDKTKYIYELIRPGSGVYFLSRPRRFGKSLLVSTLEAIFKGKKELFKGLWIGDDKNTGGFKWEEHPVIRLDMSDVSKKSPERLEHGLKQNLKMIAESHSVNCVDDDLEIMFVKLIQALRNRFNKQVAVLIDEYDKPIIDNLTKPEIAYANRDVLKRFYGILKSQDEYLRLIFVTGVSRFSKVSIFSDMNNLFDISYEPEFAGLLGYAQEELEEYFSDRLQDLVKEKLLTKEEILDKIKFWYNGYRFSREEIKVYNPFSTLLFFKTKEYRNHWFETATPTFLIDLITKKNYSISDLQGAIVSKEELVSYELDKLPLIPLMLDTGYLTIGDYARNPRTTQYTLVYPNEEVSSAFLQHFVNRYLKQANSQSYLFRLLNSVINANLEEFFEIFKEYFTDVPYDIQDAKLGEKYYQSMFYAPMKLLGMDVNPEERTNTGRMDLSLVLPDKVYIFEFKVDQPVEVAIKQIKAKKYHEKYQNQNKKVILVGVSFSSKARNIEDWREEKL